MILQLAEIRSEYATKTFALLEALQDPLVLDAALLEGEVFAEFLDLRGPLLPADEQLLGAQWLTVSRSVFEVETVQQGRGFTVRDVRTGDRIDVAEKTAPATLRPGDRLVARIVPVEDSWQIFGGIEPLGLQQYDSAIRLLDALDADDADAEDLVRFLTARFAPPTLVTTDGEPMVSCTARFEVLDPSAVMAALDARYGNDEKADDDADAAGTDEHTWTWTDSDDKHPTVLGSIVVDADGLRAETMNEKRFEALLADLAAVPGLRLENTDRVPAAELVGAGGAQAPDGNDLSVPIDDPDMLAALEEFVLDQERSWLDSEIPALGGMTPRQAADDPTRRADLVHLLNTFDGLSDRPDTMQPDRIRAALQL